jgi:hypothetical protein
MWDALVGNSSHDIPRIDPADMAALGTAVSGTEAAAAPGPSAPASRDTNRPAVAATPTIATAPMTSPPAAEVWVQPPVYLIRRRLRPQTVARLVGLLAGVALGLAVYFLLIRN